MSIRKYPLFILLLTFSMFAGASAQESGSSDEVILPDEVMQQVVSQILISEFKPEKVERIVPIADKGIKAEWLPSITNITFKLVDEKEAATYKDGVFLFESLKYDGKNYLINVGWGDLDCSASGKTWEFNFSSVSKKVQPLKIAGGWGRGCGSSSGSVDTIPNKNPVH